MVTRIDKAGIFSGIPLATYHGQFCAGPSISSSGLRTIFKRSPAHFFCNWSGNPEAEPWEETEALKFGRACHHILLGEDDFSTQFIQRPETWAGAAWNSNRTVCREWLAAQEQAGRTVLLPLELKHIRGMARSLAAHPLVKAGILNGEVERSLIWRDAETGVWLKSRPDCIPNDSGDFADLKTTTDVDYDDLAKTIADYGYHQQAALLAEGYKVLTGRPMTSFSLVFVEKRPPYCTRIVTLKDCDLERGMLQNRAALRMFAECLESGEWPGPAHDDAEFIELPKWEQDRIDSKLEFMGGRKPKQQHTAAEYAGVL